VVDTVTVSSDSPWKMMTPQAGPSNLAYEIETHVGAGCPVGIARIPPTSRVDRIKNIVVDGEVRNARMPPNIFG